MPGVVCGSCRHTADVPFRRGTRLAEIACPGCGAKALRMPRRDGATTTAGRSYETCVMCGKRRLSPLRPGYEWEPKYALGDPGPYPAGSPCCSSHEPVPAARAAHARVISDLEERLGPLAAGDWTPDDATRAALGAIARPAPRRCPVCASCGRGRQPVYAEDGDFPAGEAYQFDRGAALLTWCWDCQHTLELAALCPGGPHVAATTEPARETLGEPLSWAVAVRGPSPEPGGGEADLYWAGPVHGRRGPARDIPDAWIGTDPRDPQVMRFPGPAAAQAALDSVFAPGSRWQPPGGIRPVRIVTVPAPGSQAP